MPNMRVLPTLEEAVAASASARRWYEPIYRTYTHISLDPRIADRWWPLTAGASAKDE